jgi:glycosyltransferase involved in cell wall biosynthesis
VSETTPPTRILSVIARLNVGGPAIHAITLTRFLERRGYDVRLIRGRERPREGSMDALAERYGVTPISLPALKRDIGLSDFAALVFLVREIRTWQPQILHTHTAKAGALGRLAALLAGGRRPPIVVHTFHGHVLTGYFSRPISAVFTAIERLLASFTTCLIAVSEEVRADLIRLRVAPAERIVVLPLGFDFSTLDVSEEERHERRDAFRSSFGIPLDARVVSLVGRLEPIKRVDRFLRVATLIDDPPETWFLVVGDGALREKLQTSPEARGLGGRLVWAGLRDDMPDVYFASDVVAVTSDNEGTAVSAIEAQAAALPVVTTEVGGMRHVVADGETGYVTEREDERAFANALARVLLDRPLASRLGAAGRERAHRLFALDRLLGGVDAVYRRLLCHARPGGRTPEHATGEVTRSPSS